MNGPLFNIGCSMQVKLKYTKISHITLPTYSPLSFSLEILLALQSSFFASKVFAKILIVPHPSSSFIVAISKWMIFKCELCCAFLTVRPDLAIFYTLGYFLKPLATINLPKSLTFFGNFCKDDKFYHFSSEVIFGQFL